VRKEIRKLVLLAKARTAGKEEQIFITVLEERVDRNGLEISKCGEYFQNT